MKIILEDRDQKYIENVNEDLQALETCPPIPINSLNDKKYAIVFTATDLAKASCFALNMLSSGNREIEEALGIHVVELSFEPGHSHIDNLKALLQKTLIELDHI